MLKRIRRILMVILFVFLGLVLILCAIGFVFVKTSPQFGGEISEKKKVEYERLDYYNSGIFKNLGDVEMSMGFMDGLKVSYQFLKGGKGRRPKKDLPLLKMDTQEIQDLSDTTTRLTWFGHSAFLLETQGLKILLDPMLGQVAAPHPWLGSPRFNKELPLSIDDMPAIDAVIISHDHYDHLDYGSIIKLKEKVRMFYVPLGVDAHLKAWGVEASKIRGLAWWETTDFEDLTLICTPSQHFSGRGLSDRAATLWASWIVKTPSRSIYFSGDSGYGDHFKEIGRRYGPFDLALLECGQYNKLWKEIHMMPEETAQAAIDVNSKLMMPIHWGGFTLALHDWTDPVERVLRKAEALSQQVITPKIGEPIILGHEKEIAYWWKGF